MNGYLRFKNGIELNWSIYEWALPLSFEVTEYLIFTRFFCFSIIIPKTAVNIYNEKQK